MLVTRSGIKVISYVHTERGLVDVDELAPEEKARAATAIMLTYMNELYRGKAVFTAEGRPSSALRAPSPQGEGQERGRRASPPPGGRTEKGEHP